MIACTARLAVLAAALGLCACGSLDPGEGRKPTGLHIQLQDGSTGSYQTYECGGAQLVAMLQSDGDGGIAYDDVSTRVSWSSSNPGVIDVGAAGSMVAHTAGSAIISAEYLEFTAHFAVVANALGELRITPALTRLAPGSSQQFALEVTLAESHDPQDITTLAEWSVPSGGEAVTDLSSARLQTASDPLDRPFILRAHLANCDREALLTLQLGRVNELTLRYEQPQSLAIPLSASDLIEVEAQFEDVSAPPQNLAAQVSVEQVLGDADQSTLALDTTALKLSGTQAGSAQQYRLSYEPLNLSALTRSTVFAELGLISLRIDPQTLQLSFPDEYTLQAWGLFEDGNERPLRRHVAWSTSEEDLVSVAASGQYGGTLYPAGPSGLAEIQVLATDVDGNLLSADATVELSSD